MRTVILALCAAGAAAWAPTSLPLAPKSLGLRATVSATRPRCPSCVRTRASGKGQTPPCNQDSFACRAAALALDMKVAVFGASGRSFGFMLWCAMCVRACAKAREQVLPALRWLARPWQGVKVSSR